MEIVAWFGLACAILFALAAAVLSAAIFRLPRSKPAFGDSLPHVSVLITCRNEERDIARCLSSLAALDYPAEKLQVVAVDDRSTDSTAEIIADFCATRPNWMFARSSAASKLPGKARGIAEAARHATGEWLFITDADAAVPAGWIRGMLAPATPDTGVIGGTYDVIADSFTGVLERVTSITCLGFVTGAVGLGGAAVPLGPSMAIRRDVYEAAGGLEAADFKVAEDIALWRMSEAAGRSAVLCAEPSGCVTVVPVPSFAHMISQQRRWIAGGFGDGPAFLRPMVVMMALFALLGASASYVAAAALDPRGIAAVACIAGAMLLLLIAMRWRLRISGLLRLAPLGIPYMLTVLIWLPLSSFLYRRISWRGTGYADAYQRS